MACWRHTNIGSGNDLLPNGTKPLPRPMFTNNRRGLVPFTWGQFHGKCSSYLSLVSGWNNWFDITVASPRGQWVNTLRPRQNGRHFPDDISKWIFLNENAWISIKIPLKFIPKIPINNIPALVQIMAWRRSGDKPWSEPMMDSLLTHICFTRPQWVKGE